MHLERGFNLRRGADAAHVRLGSLAEMVSRRVMSVLPLKADIRQREWHVRYVPTADITNKQPRGTSHDL